MPVLTDVAVHGRSGGCSRSTERLLTGIYRSTTGGLSVPGIPRVDHLSVIYRQGSHHGVPFDQSYTKGTRITGTQNGSGKGVYLSGRLSLSVPYGRVYACSVGPVRCTTGVARRDQQCTEGPGTRRDHSVRRDNSVGTARIGNSVRQV